tara:strand:- start:73 stop:837 length:765 start_codon:yes stop_codon:yes gene_type:complete
MSNTDKLKIWIVTINDPLHYCPLYYDLISKSHSGFQGILILPGPMQGNILSSIKEIVYRLRFFGWKAFILTGMKYVWKKIRDDKSLKEIAALKHIPYHLVKNIDEIEAVIKDKNPDLILSSVTSLVTKKNLEIAKLGWLNTHCGILPNYKGIDAPFWSLYNEEKLIGSTIHIMNDVFDEGPIINQSVFINENLSYFKTVDKLFDANKTMLLKFLENPIEQIKRKKHQPVSTGIYFARPTVNDGKLFRSKIGKFI